MHSPCGPPRPRRSWSSSAGHDESIVAQRDGADGYHGALVAVGPGEPVYRYVLDGEGPGCRPRITCRSPRACTGRPRSWTSALPMGGRRLPARTAAGMRSSTSCTSARSPRQAPSTRRRRRSTSWSSSASPQSSSCRWPSSPAGATGATTGSSPSPCRTRTAVRAASRTSSMPATDGGLAVVLDVVYNHLGPEGNVLGCVRPLLHRPLPHAVGPGDQLRRPVLRRRAGATSGERAASGSATSTSTAFASTPSTSSIDRSARPFLAELSAWSRSSAATSGAPAGSSPRARTTTRGSSRRARRRPRHATPNGTTTSTTRCTPLLTGERDGLLRRLRAG